MASVSSSNPVFTSFAITDEHVLVGGNAQKGNVIVEKLIGSNSAKEGFPKGENIPYRDAFGDVPFGKAMLLDAEVSGSNLTLTQISGAEASSSQGGVAGTCYGVTTKDSATQLNCGFSVDLAASVPAPETGHKLVVAVFANAIVQTVDGEEVVTLTDGVEATPLACANSTVVAISEAIDPTILQVGSGNDGVSFDIPAATGGFTFTVRGTLLQPDWTKREAPVYTSFKDVVSSWPTAQAILDAKTK